MTEKQEPCAKLLEEILAVKPFEEETAIIHFTVHDDIWGLREIHLPELTIAARYGATHVKVEGWKEPREYRAITSCDIHKLEIVVYAHKNDFLKK